MLLSFFFKIMQLTSIDHLHFTFAIDWLNIVHISLRVLTDYNKSLTLVLILNFVVAFRMVMKKKQVALCNFH